MLSIKTISIGEFPCNVLKGTSILDYRLCLYVNVMRWDSFFCACGKGGKGGKGGSCGSCGAAAAEAERFPPGAAEGPTGPGPTGPGPRLLVGTRTETSSAAQLSA